MRDWLRETARECYVYGTTLRTGCSKQRPVVYGQLQLLTTCDRMTVAEPVQNASSAMSLLQGILKNYPAGEYVQDVRKNFKQGKRVVLIQVKVYSADRKRRIAEYNLV